MLKKNERGLKLNEILDNESKKEKQTCSNFILNIKAIKDEAKNSSFIYIETYSNCGELNSLDSDNDIYQTGVN